MGIDEPEDSPDEFVPPDQASEGKNPPPEARSDVVPELPHTPNGPPSPTGASQDNTPPRKRRLEYTTVGITFGLLIVNVFQMCSTQKAANAARDAAKAASDQVTLMRTQLEMQEAWIQVKIDIQTTCCDPAPKPRYGWPSGIDVTIVDRGQTPAFDVHVAVSTDLNTLPVISP